ncbi:hypothetical protein [Nocardia alni]|uniref:hypothetical protein n=1 Tax=Nocardia alni TaxID=2815723 RepID=UPI001C21D6E7|nr:hypothetical protein [Nocardia alni]
MTGTTLQLRRYRLTPDTLDAFVHWWLEDLVPIRRAYGFEIRFACITRENAELTWVVEYPGDEAAFTAAEQRYNQWPDRIDAMSRQPVKPTATSAIFVQDAL